ncbi:MAG TPA: acetyl-CoA C-acyltransferase, partial [Longimicrobiaceae bacterium]|nr:acetyl-CoA C-acyltransferase [Longimicrobiaceae bacterium]
MPEAYIIDAVRTPRGRGKKGKGSLTEIHPQELLAQTLERLAERTGIDRGEVDDVVVGCVSQAGEQGANVARQAVLAAEWPLHVSAVSLNRFCGSGLQAVNFAAMGVMSGAQDLVVGGGVESMSRQPMGSDGGGSDGHNPRLRAKHPQVPQGISADLIATLEGFAREELDRFALASQARAAQAQRECRFSRGLFPVVDPATGAVALEKDEFLRPETTLEGLAALAPSFAELGATPVGPDGETLDQLALTRYPQAGEIRHLHTAGSSSGIVDGAAAVLLASADYVRRHGLRPRARIRALATHAEEPVIMLTAPAETSRKALR